MQWLYIFALCLLIWLMVIKMFILVIRFVWSFLRRFLWEILKIISMISDRESVFRFVSTFFNVILMQLFF